MIAMRRRGKKLPLTQPPQCGGRGGATRGGPLGDEKELKKWRQGEKRKKKYEKEREKVRK